MFGDLGLVICDGRRVALPFVPPDGKGLFVGEWLVRIQSSIDAL